MDRPADALSRRGLALPPEGTSTKSGTQSARRRRPVEGAGRSPASSCVTPLGVPRTTPCAAQRAPAHMPAAREPLRARPSRISRGAASPSRPRRRRLARLRLQRAIPASATPRRASSRPPRWHGGIHAQQRSPSTAAAPRRPSCPAHRALEKRGPQAPGAPRGGARRPPPPPAGAAPGSRPAAPSRRPCRASCSRRRQRGPRRRSCCSQR
mmetsp:Transcript_85647/g.259956  ORF Transcript_85647/g.259956 Transcript_85647/m.259956 type:complete len:210 (-) Transcript_85647:646-1275(-)